MSATAYRSGIAAESARYGPFNLMLLDRHGLQFASNRGPDASLPPGIHACSNNQPGADWPKVQWLATALKNTLGEPGGTEEIATNDLVARLLEVLSGPSSRGTRTSAPESVFVVGEEFGTRCSTVLAIDRAGRGTFLERSFDRAGTAVGDRQFHFTVPVLATAQPR
jgi:uncharacterized protein with NRDE domain